MTVICLIRKKEEEAALYASLKEARLAAKQLEEEKMRSQEEVQLRVNDLRVSCFINSLS